MTPAPSSAQPSGQLSGQHRAPHDCPVCREGLHVTQLGCDNCGTGITGDFEQCDFCALSGQDLDVLRVFLASRGNMKDLERHLGVSYPTARGRFDDLLRKLGLGSGGTSPSEPAPRVIEDDEQRLATLRALAGGSLDVDEARRRLT